MKGKKEARLQTLTQKYTQEGEFICEGRRYNVPVDVADERSGKGGSAYSVSIAKQQ